MARQTRPYRILVVEDNLADVSLLRLALKDAEIDFDLTALRDGAEALAFIRREGKYADAPRPDLAILDLSIPKHSGGEVLQAIRSTEELRSLPAVIWTSLGSPAALAETKSLGIELHIVKPSDLKQYLEIGQTLKQIISKARKKNQ